MDWITEHVAIGNFRDAEAVTAEQVDAILCLRPDCSCEERDDVDVLQVPLIDGPGNSRADVVEAVEFVRDCAGAGDRVLVHCHAGRSRSVCVVAAWLIAKTGRRRAEALHFVASRRTGGIYLSTGVEQLLDIAEGV